jgi:hypothetical protein
MRYTVIAIAVIAIFGGLYSVTRPTNDLRARCRAYLDSGPPPSMTNYVPGSLTEIIIAHGAESLPIDPELLEIGGIIVSESDNRKPDADLAVREYMRVGAALVREVIGRQP